MSNEAGDWSAALLCNTIPAGAILVVLILMFGPVSGTHFQFHGYAGIRSPL
jgi:hypothetical protein